MFFHRGCSESGVASFFNLGKDAKLVAPCPKEGERDSNYTHLASFIRYGDKEQVKYCLSNNNNLS